MNPYTISITTGDIDGIGTEVAAKALAQIGPDPKIRYIFCRSPHCPKSHLSILKEKFRLVPVSTWKEVFTQTEIPENGLIDFPAETDPTCWFEHSTDLCLKKKIDGIVTAPLSKIEMMRSPFPHLGHTELLRSK